MIKHSISGFIVLLCSLLLITACSDTSSASSSNLAPIYTHSNQRSSAIGSFKEYSLPQTGSGAMRPAIDSKGRLWFGEMNRNFLTMFDPYTQTFEQITPPHGAYSIMGVLADRDNTIWFAEQDANYIGHYFPDTKRFQTYSLPILHTPDPTNAKNILTLPSGPNDIAFDAHGNLWFTELNADSLGMLNTKTGIIQQFSISRTRSVQTLSPYGITIDAHDMVWFTESASNHIGRLDPHTGTIRLFTVASSSPVPLMEIASDVHGSIWVTSFSGNQLLRLDPTTGAFTAYTAPSITPGSGGLYGLIVTANNEVWVTVPSENSLARFDTTTNRFIYHAIPSSSSFPFGLVVDAHHSIWFTEANSDKIGMLQQ